jgi:hypothetical protein
VAHARRFLLDHGLDAVAAQRSRSGRLTEVGAVGRVNAAGGRPRFIVHFGTARPPTCILWKRPQHNQTLCGRRTVNWRRLPRRCRPRRPIRAAEHGSAQTPSWGQRSEGFATRRGRACFAGRARSAIRGATEFGALAPLGVRGGRRCAAV